MNVFINVWSKLDKQQKCEDWALHDGSVMDMGIARFIADSPYSIYPINIISVQVRFYILSHTSW